MASTIKREACNYCGSSDNVCHWIDDKTGVLRIRCLTPDCEFNKKNVGDVIKLPLKSNSNLLEGQVVPLPTRGLTEETAKRAGISVTKINNKWVTIFDYKKDQEVVFQKVKYHAEPGTKKTMEMRGDTTNTDLLYLSHLWEPNPKLFITITEGEEDAASVMQAQDYQFPVVSIPKGAQGARRALEANLKYLLGFKYVVLGFDNDEHGQKATKQCLDLFEPGRVRVAKWALKDANDLLKAGRIKEIKDAIFFAQEVVPEGSVTVEDILDEILVPPKKGIDFPWKTMTDVTYGLKGGEIYLLIGPTACGKTEILKDIMFHVLKDGMKVGIFSFEQKPASTIRRLVGAKLGRKLHLPGQDQGLDIDAIKNQALDLNKKIYLYDRAGRANIQDLFNTMRYWAKAKGTKLFILDNLKSLNFAKDIDKATDFMNDLKSLMLELNTDIFLVSHVAKNKYQISTSVRSRQSEDEEDKAEDVDARMRKPGLHWESGRMPTAEDCEGSNTIVGLCDFAFAAGRNRVSVDLNERKIINISTIKARLDGEKDGTKWKLMSSDNGLLVEVDEFRERVF